MSDDPLQIPVIAQLPQRPHTGRQIGVASRILPPMEVGPLLGIPVDDVFSARVTSVGDEDQWRLVVTQFPGAELPAKPKITAALTDREIDALQQGKHVIPGSVAGGDLELWRHETFGLERRRVPVPLGDSNKLVVEARRSMRPHWFIEIQTGGATVRVQGKNVGTMRQVARALDEAADFLEREEA